MQQMPMAKLLAHGAVILEAAGIENTQLEAQVLLAAACGVDRTVLFRDGAQLVTTTSADRYAGLLRRRASREPLQYIVGRQEFWSLDFEVTPDVLIPRPETELLVELALKLFAGRPTPAICDVGTGSGCIAVALATEVPDAEITAIDVSPTALELAAANARRHTVDARIRFVQSDLLDRVDATLHLIVSNPPYVAAHTQLQPELGYEPVTALFAGNDGLAVIRRLIPQAASKLLPEGVLLMEIGAAQAADVTHLASGAGFSDVAIELDLAGLPRVLVAKK